MNNSTYECFQRAARIETLAQELYAGLAETYVGRPHLRDLFAQLAEEERQHALRIWLLARHQGNSPWAAEAVGKIVAGLSDMAVELESMRDDFEKGGEVPDPGAVLARIVDVERRFGFIHADQMARTGDAAVSGLFTALASQDARHQALIEGARSRDPARDLGN
jgi:rubrerythrin